MAENHQDPPDAPPPKTTVSCAGRIVGRLRAVLGKLLADPFRVAIILAVNVAVVAGVVSTALILRNYKPPPKPATLALALGALDRGDKAEARSMAERLAASKNITNEDWGGPDFILGSLAARDAEEARGDQRKESFRVASLYLARSRQRGFPAHRESVGLYLLGKSLSGCGRLQDALPVLEQALAQNRRARVRRARGRNPLAADRGLHGGPTAGTRQGPDGKPETALRSTVPGRRTPAGPHPAGRDPAPHGPPAGVRRGVGQDPRRRLAARQHLAAAGKTGAGRRPGNEAGGPAITPRWKIRNPRPGVPGAPEIRNGEQRTSSPGGRREQAEVPLRQSSSSARP